MTETVLSAFIAFIGTNIDDMFINTLFFSEAESKGKVRRVVAGKYLGVGLLVLVSILGAFGLGFLPNRHIGILGLVPIGLGIKEIVCNLKAKENGEEGKSTGKTKGSTLNVMIVTVANGADNIGVYIPLFVGYGPWQLVTAVCVFAAMTALWCFLGKKLSDLPVLQRFLSRYSHIAVPCVYIALGVYIILKNII